jgi:hypothetical protein
MRAALTPETAAPLVAPSPAAAQAAGTPARAIPPPLREIVAPIVEANASNAIGIVDDARGLVISLPESASFATGSATLATTAAHFLRGLAQAVESRHVQIRDRRSYRRRAGLGWPVWFELGAVHRARQRRGRVPDQRHDSRQTGSGPPATRSFTRVVPNDSTDSRARNRRVDVVLIDPAQQ